MNDYDKSSNIANDLSRTNTPVINSSHTFDAIQAMSFESESDRVYSFSQSDQRSRGNWGRGVWACLVILSILIAISHAFLALVAFHLLSSNSDYKYSPDSTHNKHKQ